MGMRVGFVPLIALSVVFMLFVLAPTVKAYPYAYLNVSDSLSQYDNTVTNNVTYVISVFNTSNQISIPLFGSISSLHVYNKYGRQVPFVGSSTPQYYFINISNVSQGSTFVIEYMSSQHLQVNDSLYTASYSLVPPMFLSMAKIEVTLPLGAFIPSQNQTFMSPPAYSVTSNGKEIQVIWIIENQTFFDHSYFVFPFSVLYAFYTPPTTSRPVGMTDIIAVAAVIVGAILIVLVFLRSRKGSPIEMRKKSTRNQIVSILSPDEKKVLDLIRRREKVYQHELVEMTGFSKAKLSKIISKLVNYKLVKKKQMGKINELKYNKP